MAFSYQNAFLIYKTWELEILAEQGQSWVKFYCQDQRVSNILYYTYRENKQVYVKTIRTRAALMSDVGDLN